VHFLFHWFLSHKFNTCIFDCTTYSSLAVSVSPVCNLSSSPFIHFWQHSPQEYSVIYCLLSLADVIHYRETFFLSITPRENFPHLLPCSIDNFCVLLHSGRIQETFSKTFVSQVSLRAKMPSKKKKKKQDFQKVKLKVGRKLARPTNETRAQFKVRGINIKSQFHSEHLAVHDGTEASSTSVKVSDLLPVSTSNWHYHSGVIVFHICMFLIYDSIKWVCHFTFLFYVHVGNVLKYGANVVVMLEMIAVNR